MYCSSLDTVLQITENVMCKASWIKDPISILAGMNLQNVMESVCLFGENGQLQRVAVRSVFTVCYIVTILNFCVL